MPLPQQLLTDRTNHFFITGESLSTMMDGFSTMMKLLTMLTFPRFSKMLHLKLMNEKDAQYCRDIVKSNMDYREKNNVIRNDVIQLLMDVKKGLLTDYLLQWETIEL